MTLKRRQSLRSGMINCGLRGQSALASSSSSPERQETVKEWTINHYSDGNNQREPADIIVNRL